MLKGIRSLITIKASNKSVISIINSNGKSETKPTEIVNYFNKYFVNVGTNVERKIPISDIPCTDYLKKICNDDSFYLRPVKFYEIVEIINSFDLNKSLGPNSIPIFILKLCIDFSNN